MQEARLDALKRSRFSNFKHGKSNSRAYASWTNMKSRCYDPNDISYKNYGARGIIVCKQWLISFENFYNDMGDPPNGLTLDRKDVNGNYEKDNCRWATWKQQARNTRKSKFVEYNGERVLLIELCEALNLDAGVIRGRLKGGWDLQLALDTPKRYKTPNGTPERIRLNRAWKQLNSVFNKILTENDYFSLASV